MSDSVTPHISVVVPVYGSADVLEELYERTVKTVSPITPNFEFIFVNDASPDHAWEVIKKIKSRDNRVRGINLSRNFGQYPALTAGLSASRGEWIVVMDCDLQDLPETIEQMYQKAQEGFYVVVGSRKERHDSRLRLLASWGFYSSLSYTTERYHDRSLANFGIYHRRVIDAVLSIGDRMRYFSVMVRWVGFRTAVIPITHASRKGGVSGYSFRKLFGLATDIILAYSERPLRAIIKIGTGVTFVSILYIIFATTNGLDTPFSHSSELIIGSLWLIFGLLGIILGLIALYIGKIFEETKKRPIYIVQEEV